MIEHARTAHKCGWTIFPLKPKSKQPLTAHGFKDATRVPELLGKWWSENPHANVGVACGESGLAVLDCDKGLANVEEFEAWRTRNNIPLSYAVRTGRRVNDKGEPAFGVQIYYAGAVPTTANWKLDGVSGYVKSLGGYVLAAGCVDPDSGETYQVISDAPIVPTPDVVKSLKPFKPARSAAAPGPAGTQPKIAHGGRYNALASYAGRLLNAGMNREDMIYQALVDYLFAECENPETADMAPIRKLAFDTSHKFEQSEQPEPIVVQAATEVVLPDMPEACLDGWLGRLCKERMPDCARAYAWVALVTVASALVSSNQQVRLYGVNVGPVGSGKSQAIDWACHLLGLGAVPAELPLLQLMSGSPEGLVKRLQDVPPGASVIIYPDELGHLLTKAKIEGSTFPFVLNAAFYNDALEFTSAGGRQMKLNCKFSIMGGIVDNVFQDLFSSQTIGGFYDRTIFECVPTGFMWGYTPFTGEPALERVSTDEDAPSVAARPVPVTAHPDVWELQKQWKREHPSLKNSRTTELAIRVALVCAAFDGRPMLHAADLGPALQFALWQARARTLLVPNPGETLEGIASSKILSFLDANAPAVREGAAEDWKPGPWVSRRKMFQAIHAARLGHGLFERALRSLTYSGEVEQGTAPTTKGCKTLKVLRRLPESWNEQ